MTLFCLPTALDRSRLGIAATRKIGKAVQRNLARRRLREIFRAHRPAGAFDVVIVPRREFFEATYAGVEAEYRALLTRQRRGPRRDGSSRTR
jgi:ribonuclease P protein component